MRIVLDTNVFVSGIFFSGPPHRILRVWRDGSVKSVYSAARTMTSCALRPVLCITASQ